MGHVCLCLVHGCLYWDRHQCFFLDWTGVQRRGWLRAYAVRIVIRVEVVGVVFVGGQSLRCRHLAHFLVSLPVLLLTIGTAVGHSTSTALETRRWLSTSYARLNRTNGGG